MTKIFFERALKYYKIYVDTQKRRVVKSGNEVSEKLELINKSVQDTMEITDLGSNLMKDLKVSPSILELGKIVLINHDLGSLYQIRTGNRDNKNELTVKILDDTLLRLELPATDIYDDIVKEAIRRQDEDTILSVIDSFKDNDLYEVFKKGDEDLKRKLVTLYMYVLNESKKVKTLKKSFDNKL